MSRKSALLAAARKLALDTSDAYSVPAYRSWESVAKLLVVTMELRIEEAEVVMRSKWTRWAADMSDTRYGAVPAKAVGDYFASLKNWRIELDALCAEAGVETHRYVRNLMSKEMFRERIGTPAYMSPACESYWSM